ncbi:hypothetical protein BCR34DRAFT_602413 [Clohesyomyces aquaticus]|uniref:Uncharacterized protein n=1 Tax=Clohesyomyces aquaticus TaxID=1231657 RepID=A0A1Y1ZI91_9PLEO|nr:hypothetical protein BCR34DRAFT_602413 [Clohesyomyces aquaticus]
MATASLPPPQKGAAENSALVGEAQFGALQAMMNLVLVSTGNYLREQREENASGRMLNMMKRSVPLAMERFQGALDELENELHQAQTVLRRDLALLQADRIKREQAEAAERQRLAAESSAKKNVVEKEEVAIKDAPAAATDSEAATQDLVPPSTADPQPAALERAQSPPPPISTAAAPIGDPLFDGTPTTANPQDAEFDFDAIFGDSVMDTAGDASNEHGDIDMHDSGADLHFSLDDPGPLDDHVQADDSGPSLLRGLEDFAKVGDDTATGQSGGNLDIDFSMPDLPDVTTDQPATHEEPKPAETATVSADQQPTDTGDNTDMLNTMDTMPVDNLDDLFNLDGYDNPENTEFEDAFFGFGES